MRTVQVKLGDRSYRIEVGPGAPGHLPALLGETRRQIVVISDGKVAGLHLKTLLGVLGDRSPVVLTVPPGEASKSLETAGRLYAALAQAKIDRGDLIIAFGGGVVGDLAGFVAATWHRGLAFIQVPTTLEAAVDASVGGKTAVNLSAGKNLVGVFHQPAGVFIDTDFLATLPQRDFVAGLAESIKHAAIRSEPFLAWHEQHAEAILARDPGVVSELIARNCEIKAAVVAQDERETGLRAILNYGHTVGHAIEHLLGYELRHGECVAVGMIVAGDLSCRLAGLPRDSAARIAGLIARLGLPTRPPRPLDPTRIVECCRLDKKVRGGALRFVLLQAIGHPLQMPDVAEPDLTASLAAVFSPSVT